VEGSSEHGSEQFCSMKGGELVDYLSVFLASQEDLCAMELFMTVDVLNFSDVFNLVFSQ
jgi:hypothetical protein